MAHEASTDSFCGQGQTRDADPWVCYCSWNLQDKSRVGGGGAGGVNNQLTVLSSC